MIVHENFKELTWVPKNAQSVLTGAEMFRICTTWLQKHCEEWEKLIEMLDYFQPDSFDHKPMHVLGENLRNRTQVDPGGSEGIYIDWFLSGAGIISVGTFKTLREDMEAFETMGAISGLLQYVSDLFLFVNWDIIFKKKGEENGTV